MCITFTFRSRVQYPISKTSSQNKKLLLISYFVIADTRGIQKRAASVKKLDFHGKMIQTSREFSRKFRGNGIVD